MEGEERGQSRAVGQDQGFDLERVRGEIVGRSPNFVECHWSELGHRSYQIMEDVKSLPFRRPCWISPSLGQTGDKRLEGVRQVDLFGRSSGVNLWDQCGGL